MMDNYLDDDQDQRVLHNPKTAKAKVAIPSFFGGPAGFRVSGADGQDTPQFMSDPAATKRASQLFDPQKTRLAFEAQLEDEIREKRQTALADIENEKQRILDEAYQEGLQKGKAENEQKMAHLGGELLDAIGSAVAEKNTILHDADRDIISLALAVAEKIVQTELDKNPDVYHNILAESFRRLTAKEKVIVRVNPLDTEHVKSFQDKFDTLLSDIKTVEILEDPKIEHGGVVLETKLGYIDSSIKTKFSLIEKTLIQTVAEEKESIIPEKTDALPEPAAPPPPPETELNLDLPEAPSATAEPSVMEPNLSSSFDSGDSGDSDALDFSSIFDELENEDPSL